MALLLLFLLAALALDAFPVLALVPQGRRRIGAPINSRLTIRRVNGIHAHFAMRADDSPHVPHLKAMPDGREALVGATGRLARALLAVEVQEMNLLATAAQRSADKTGGIAYDARAYAGLMKRVRALDARPGLPSDLRETVLDRLARDEGWTADRKRVG